MAKTLIREVQVLDSDFLSEQEFADAMGIPGGVAPLDENNKVPTIHLPPIEDISTILPTATEPNLIIKSDSNNDWIVVPADDPDEGLKVIALPYYYDEVRQKYLDNQLIRVVFYENGDNIRNRYLNYIPEIRSDRVPFRIYQNEQYCIVNAGYYATNSESGNILTLLDTANGNNTLANVTLGAATDTFFIDTLNIDLLAGTDLAVYANNIRLGNPTLILGLRKIWTPEV